ncbi:MAG: HD domain-containing protein, partial [Acidobacteriaceae bacterium]|nr:HD domain-containing protein [Acidobacteriaceae bacterium]
LIIDVGGGSAELIVSHNGQLIDAVSKPLGAVRLTEVFLKTDPPTNDELRRLQAYIEEKIAPFHRTHGQEKFQRAVVTSATAGAIVSAANGISRAKRDEGDRFCARAPQVRDLYARLSKSDVAARRRFVGIGPRRAEIIIAGAAVFLRALELFELRSLCYSVAGVRDGIIADLAARRVGRELSQLSREQRSIVETMAKRYGVALKHARHVAALAQQLFDVLQPVHKLAPETGKLLESSAYLHDIGHYVSDTGHHKHSAYLVANSDMPGFTVKERLTIAALCRFHRKMMPQARHSHFQALDAESKKTVLCLAPILRIADALDRGHEQKVLQISGAEKDGNINLQIEASRDADLEIWAATEAAQTFREVYNLPLAVQRAKKRTPSADKP